MFYDIFKQLATEKGISVNKATKEIGLSESIATKWKKTAAIPKGDTLNKIADYFNVSVDYLLGNSNDTKNTINKTNSAKTRTKEEDELIQLAKLTNNEKRLSKLTDEQRTKLAQAMRLYSEATPEMQKAILATLEAAVEEKNK